MDDVKPAGQTVPLEPIVGPGVWLATEDGWYVHQLRGAVFVSWVTEAERGHAAVFPAAKSRQWIDLLSDWTGKTLKVVLPNAQAQRAAEGGPLEPVVGTDSGGR